MPNIAMIDTLTAFIDIKEYEEQAAGFLNILEEKKSKAKIRQANNEEAELLEIDNMTWQVLSNGKEGYAYILHNELYELDFAQFRSKNKSFFPVFIKIKSQALWSMSPAYAWKHICSWISNNIGEILIDRISRIDLCCHTDEFYLENSETADFKGQFYIDNTYRYRRQISAIYFGSSSTGKVYGRIYDKTLEVAQKKQKTWFYDIWQNAGMNIEKVWNIEFQVSREYLKEHCIDSVHDAFERLGTMWQYCTEYWLVKIVPDNANISRCSIDDRWKPIQGAFEGYENKPLIDREKQLCADADAMIPSLFGTFTSFAARRGKTDLRSALNSMVVSGNSYLRSKKVDFNDVVKTKQSLLDKKPAITGVPIPESEIMVGDKTVFEIAKEDAYGQACL